MSKRRVILDLADIGRAGKRFCAFYRGYEARKSGRGDNPHKPGTEEHACWQAGWEYAQIEQDEKPPVCRFGPGGDFVRDWPEREDVKP